MSFIPNSIVIHTVILLAGFAILWKCAELLVDGAVGLAVRLGVPNIIVGIVLVSFMTTAPEFAVSIISAVRGIPQIALGNAVGSVVADDGLALALGVIVAPRALTVDSRVLKTTGVFLVAVDLLAFALSRNGTVSRSEGIVLLAILVGYLTVLALSESRKRRKAQSASRADESESSVPVEHAPLTGRIVRFLVGVAGVLVASEFLVGSAQYVAGKIGVPSAVIGLTVVALGTSIPEVATAIVAARKGHADLAFGDIIGADILNILWIVGASATAHPLTVGVKVTSFSFPAMLVVVVTMLVLAAFGNRLQRWKGFVLLAEYFVYLGLTFTLFRT